MKNLRGKIAAVTGAGSGIGRATAIALASEGCDVAISDINKEGLEETESIIEGKGVRVSTTILDVSVKKDVHAWADKVIREHGKVNIIVNNAGVGVGAIIEKMTYEDFEWLFNINFWGMVYGTKAFLPLLKEAGEGHVVNISSVFGIIGVPTQAAYNCAKFGIRGFTEVLRQELDIDDCNVSATSIHPGGIKTNIARDSRFGDMGKISVDLNNVAQMFDKLAFTSSEKAAKCIVKGIKKNKRRVLIGPDAYMIDIMQRCLPTTYQKLITFGAKRFAK